MNSNISLNGAKLVFDTNAFGILVQDKSYEEIDSIAEKIKIHRTLNNYDIFLDINVCNELLRHLKATPGSKDYVRCKKSVYLIGKIMNKGSIDSLFLHNPSWQRQMAYFFMGCNPEELVQYDKTVIEFIEDLSANLEDQTIQQCKPNFESSEKDWIANRNNLISSILKGIQMDSEISAIEELSRNEKARIKILNKINVPFFSTAFTLSVYLQVHKFHLRISPFKVIMRFGKLNKILMPASKFFGEFWRKLINGLSQKGNKVESNPDHTRWNSITDTLIIISSQLANCMFITNEQEIIKAYNESGFADRIIDANDYMAML